LGRSLRRRLIVHGRTNTSSWREQQLLKRLLRETLKHRVVARSRRKNGRNSLNLVRK
jgi:hypothetical protein